MKIQVPFKVVARTRKQSAFIQLALFACGFHWDSWTSDNDHVIDTLLLLGVKPGIVNGLPEMFYEDKIEEFDKITVDANGFKFCTYSYEEFVDSLPSDVIDDVIEKRRDNYYYNL